MKIPCLCINDKNKPYQIPQNKWVTEGEIYNVQHIFHQIQQKGVKGVELAGIDLSDCFPYNCFDLSRFAFKVEDLPKLEILIKHCTKLNDIDVLSIIGDLTRIKPEITTDTLISDCKLSIRSKNLLENANIKTIKDLVNISKRDLMKYRNLGVKSLKEIDSFLKDNGYEFKEE